MPRLSVIVPVYKVEKYIHKCVESILNQTFTDFELILVDDGSPDDCGRICDEYAKKDARVRVIHKENGGQSSARNIGLDAARGEIIGFVDSDDDIDINMYQYLIEFMDKEKLDLVFCDVYLIRGTRIREQSMYSSNKVLSREQGLNDNLICKIDNAVWNKIYKKDIFENLRFTEGIVYEDVRIMYKIFDRIKKSGYLKKSLYYYYKRKNSTIAQSFNSKSRYDCFKGYKERLEFSIKENLECVEMCRVLAVETALATLTAFYANKEDENSDRYKDVESFLNVNSAEVKSKLKGKKRFLLWSFENCKYIHKMYAKLSATSKKIK